MKRSKNVQLYARAILELAEEKNDVNLFVKDFDFLFGLESSEPNFTKFLKLPFYSIESKYKLLEQSLESKVSDLFLNFVKFLIKKNQIHLIHEIYREYLDSADLKENRVRVIITTVELLSKEEIEKMENSLAKKFDAKIVIQNVVSQEIIGGLILQVGDIYIDGSLKGKLDKIHKHILKLSKLKAMSLLAKI